MFKSLTPFVRFLIFWVAALALEYPFFAAIITQNEKLLTDNFNTTIAVHVMAAVALFFCESKKKGWFHHERNWAQFLFFMTLFLPLFGTLFGGILFFFSKDHKEAIHDMAGEDDAFFNVYKEKILKEPPRIDWQNFMTEASDCQPLADILTLNDNALKRDAIDKLAALATPESIKILLDNRRNESAEVRFFVTTSLSRLKKNFEDDLNAAKLEIKNSNYKASARLFLARVYQRYALSGLLDKTTATGYLTEAKHHLEKILSEGQIEPKAAWFLLDVIQSQANWREALRLVHDFEEKKILTAVESAKAKALYHFKLGEFDFVAAALKKISDEGDNDPAFKAAALWWGT